MWGMRKLRLDVGIHHATLKSIQGRPCPPHAAWPQQVFRCMASSPEVGPLTRLEIDSDKCARLTLTRPKKLNSLSLPMMSELKDKYAEVVRSGVRCLFLSGEGRAFCAGGDVAEVREGILAGNTLPADFFFEEYSLDYEIACLHKDKGVLQVALWDGIVMGGGVGLSIHSPLRIATEKTLFAMPETAIGLFPDVAATRLLPNLPAGEHVGIFLGLTGQRLNAADCLHAGIATHYCPSELLGEVEQRIRALGEGASDCDAVSAVISEVADNAAPDMSKAILAANDAAMKQCFGGAVQSAEEIVARLQSIDSDWAKRSLAMLQRHSPTSVKVSLEAMRRHRSISLRDAFVAEYRMSQWCMRPQPESDFCEGIRAVLVDKDNQPVWTPATIEEVSMEKVAEFFEPLGQDHPRGELQI